MPHGWRKSWLLTLVLFPGTGLASPEIPSPLLPARHILLENTAYSAAYDPEYKQSSWVFYGLGQNELRSCVNRSNSFRPDPRLPPSQGPQLSDYAGSGFDRGHLIPAGDNRWSPEAMRESFLLTNISPQPSRFNSGIWARLEGLVRAWAKNAANGLWVATGPLLKSGLPTIGTGRVAVPEFFYKVLATRAPNEKTRAVAFLLPGNAAGDLSQYAMTVDQLENITGLDFLAGLSGEEEAEAAFSPADWDRSARFSYLPCQAFAPDSREWAWGLSAGR